MKLEIEVYDLNQKLYYMSENTIKEFKPTALVIVSEYKGYSGDYWGDVSCGKGGGYPIRMKYSNNEGKSFVYHHQLFPTKEALIENLKQMTIQ